MPGSFHNRQDEIVSLVRQLTLEVCSKHILFCTSILQLPIREEYKQQESAGERIRCSLSRDTKFLAEKRLGFGMSKFLCFYSCKEFTYMCMTDFFPRACWNYSSQNLDYSESWECLSDPLK